MAVPRMMSTNRAEAAELVRVMSLLNMMKEAKSGGLYLSVESRDSPHPFRESRDSTVKEITEFYHSSRWWWTVGTTGTTQHQIAVIATVISGSYRWYKSYSLLCNGPTDRERSRQASATCSVRGSLITL